MSTRVVFDDRELWKLPAGTTFREIGRLGRTFTVGARPGRLWHGRTPCDVDSVELPVEVSQR